MLELMKLNRHIYTKVKEIKSTFYTIHIIVIKRKLDNTLAKILESIFNFDRFII